MNLQDYSLKQPSNQIWITLMAFLFTLAGIGVLTNTWEITLSASFGFFVTMIIPYKKIDRHFNWNTDSGMVTGKRNG